MVVRFIMYFQMISRVMGRYTLVNTGKNEEGVALFLSCVY